MMFVILLGLHGMPSGTEHRGVELKGVGKFVKMTWILQRPQCLVCCHVRCLQWLVEHGADTTTPDLNGYTPQQLSDEPINS